MSLVSRGGDAAAQAHGRAGMSAPANCKLIGQWRIVEADLWDRDYLDLCGPAVIAAWTALGKIRVHIVAL